MKHGFTIIELLVVITIIVVLLALLTPALDRAIYQAELAVCGANMRSGGNAIVTYAFDHKRRYPVRPSIWMPPFEFYDAEGSPDLRPVLRNYMDINTIFNDPMNDDVDFANSSISTRIYSDYNMWFGYRYQTNGSTERSAQNDLLGSALTWERGMLKLGDKLGYKGEQFDVLVSDQSRMDTNGPNTLSVSSHPDYDKVMSPARFQDERAPHGLVITVSWWDELLDRGPVDLNFLRDDGSVDRYLKVLRVDARMAQLTQDGDSRNPNLVINLPR